MYKQSYVIKIKSRKDLLEGGYGVAVKLDQLHPEWVGNYRMVYEDTDTTLAFIERDRRFICFQYLYSEKLTLEEALEVCPEVLI